jgi:hypothetical protein
VGICYSACARKPASHRAQTPSTPHYDYRRVLTLPSKSQNSSPLTEWRKKKVICITTRTLQGVRFPAYPSLRKTPGAPGEKNLKNPTTGVQGIKTLTQNNSSCINLNTE